MAFLFFFLILFGIFLQSGMGLFGLGFEGVVGELPVICSKIFFFYVSGNGTYSSTTGQFSHMENVSSLF